MMTPGGVIIVCSICIYDDTRRRDDRLFCWRFIIVVFFKITTMKRSSRATNNKTFTSSSQYVHCSRIYAYCALHRSREVNCSSSANLKVHSLVQFNSVQSRITRASHYGSPTCLLLHSLGWFVSLQCFWIRDEWQNMSGPFRLVFKTSFCEVRKTRRDLLSHK